MKKGFTEFFKSAAALLLSASIVMPSAVTATSQIASAVQAGNYKKGDISLDSKVDILDVTLGRNHIVGNGALDDFQLVLADMNNDKLLDISDIVILRSNIVNDIDGGTVTVGEDSTDTDTVSDTDTVTDKDTASDTDTATDKDTASDSDSSTDTASDKDTDSAADTDTAPEIDTSFEVYAIVDNEIYAEKISSSSKTGAIDDTDNEFMNVGEGPGFYSYGIPFILPETEGLVDVKIEVYAKGQGSPKIYLWDSAKEVVDSKSISESDWTNLKTTPATFVFKKSALAPGQYYAGVQANEYINIYKIVIKITSSKVVNPLPDTDSDSNPNDGLDTDVTNSTIDNFADYEGVISNVDINGTDLYSQKGLVKNFGSFGNLYDKSLYDNGTGSDVGIAFCGWNLYNYLEDPSLEYKMSYFMETGEYGAKRMTFIPTYFLATYSEGIKVNGTDTLSTDQQADIMAEALKNNVRLNYRLHIDPQRFAPDGGNYSSVDVNVPGSQWWRGEFTQVDPMGDDYLAMVDQGFEALEKTMKKIGSTKLVEPIRFDIGAELMTSVKNYTANWLELIEYCKAKRDASPYLRDNVVIGYNFCHHIEYLIELDQHADYFGRINGTGVTYLDRQDLLFVDDMPEENRQLLGQFIKNLDVFSVSQYMPMDMFAEADLKSTDVETTPEDVRDALLTHEQNFLQKVLMGKLGLKPDEIPPFYLGEYGMGIKGLSAPNVWDRTAWSDSELATYEVQQKHAEIAIKGLMLYMQDERSVAMTLSLWLSGAPYDVINFYPGMNVGDSGHGYPGKAAYNPNADAALKKYWKTGSVS